MKTIKGPGLFLAQFAGDRAPFDSLGSIAKWAADLGYRGVQIPSGDRRVFDLDLAADSDGYCDEVKGILADAGVVVTELSTHLQGQLVAVHPAYDQLFDGFAPQEVRGNPKARQEWAVGQLMKAARASRRLGLTSHASFSGSLAWPYVFPWPVRGQDLIETAFTELARRWTPILDAFDEAGVDVAYEIHPSEDPFDGLTFERFYARTGEHPRCCILFDPSHLHLQHIDYLGYIDVYHERIRAFHVKDAEIVPSARQGTYGGYQPWPERSGRFRSPGDGQIDFKGIFSRLTQHGFDGWAVMEWECVIKSPAQGAREGAPYIACNIIEASDTALDDYAARGGMTEDTSRTILGIDR